MSFRKNAGDVDVDECVVGMIVWMWLSFDR